MSKSVIDSVNQFISKIQEDIKFWGKGFDTAWFRGQQKGTLLPKIYKGRYNKEKENLLVQEFRICAPAVYDKTPHYDRIDEWLFLMQHALLPTRLLDWSEGALIALFFAIGEFWKHKKSKPVVWMLNPILFNEFANNRSFLPLSWNDDSYRYKFKKGENRTNSNPVVINGVEYERLSCSSNFCASFGDRIYEDKMPLALRPQHVHQRVAVQRGCFTIHGKIRKGIEKLFETKIFDDTDYLNVFKKFNYPKNDFGTFIKDKKFNDVFLKEYIINPDINVLKDIEKNLRILGILNSTLFPDIDGLARELSRKY